MRHHHLQITGYQRADRAGLLDLMRRSQWTHSHLDFIDAADWLAGDGRLVYLAWQGGQLQGWMGLSPSVAGWRWIRLLGIRDGRRPDALLRTLWARAASDLRCCADSGVAVLAQTNWLGTYLAALGFRSDDALIVMRHIGSRLPKAPQSSACLRPAEADDLAILLSLDRQAFAPPWQITAEELWRSFRRCMIATVALLRGAIVGYLLCSRHGDIAHVARLAVRPACQGQGVASLLLHDLLADLLRGDFQEITVNTQRGNLRSQRLYARYGFLPSGKDFAIWQRTLAGEGA